MVKNMCYLLEGHRFKTDEVGLLNWPLVTTRPMGTVGPLALTLLPLPRQNSPIVIMCIHLYPIIFPMSAWRVSSLGVGTNMWFGSFQARMISFLRNEGHPLEAAHK